MKVKCAQKGAMLIFVAGFVIPLLFLLTSAAVDVQAYTNKLEEVQSIADDAVLFGARYLPDSEAADRNVTSYFLSHGGEGNLSVSSTPDIVSLKIEGVFSPFIANFFDKALGVKTEIPFAATSQARGNPLDVYIATDRSGYLSPEFSTSDSDAWGDISTWGAAEIFNSLLTVQYAGGTLHSRIATQQCFNPTFALIKKTAVRAFDFFAAFKMNRVAVHFFPGARTLIGKTHEMNAGMNGAESVTFYDERQDWDVDQYVTVSETEDNQAFPVQSVYCASIGESEPFYTQYRIPESPSYFSETNGGTLINQSDWSINPDYPLLVREKIWSRAVNKSSEMDFGLVLNAMKQSLFQSGQISQRKGLVNSAGQVAFVITDRLPSIGGDRFVNGSDGVAAAMHQIFQSIRDIKQKQTSKLTVYYLLLGGTIAEAETLSAFFVDEIFKTEDGTVLFEPKVIRSQDPDTFLSKILASLVLEQRSHVVSQ